MTITVLASGTAILAQPAKDDVQAALEKHFEAENAQLLDFAFKIFVGSEPGTGRVAVEGGVAFNDAIARETNRRAFYPEMDYSSWSDIRSVAGLLPIKTASGALWRKVYEPGDPLPFSGNLHFVEGVSTFNWKIDVRVDFPEGEFAKNIPPGEYLEGSPEFDSAEQKIRMLEDQAEAVQANFGRQIASEIAGRTFMHMDQCNDVKNFKIMFYPEPVASKFGGPEDLFRAEIMLEGELDFTGSERFPPPREAVDGRLKFRKPIIFRIHTQSRTWRVEFEREWFYWDGAEFKRSTAQNFFGTWGRYPAFTGFSNGHPGNGCSPLAIIQQ